MSSTSPWTGLCAVGFCKWLHVNVPLVFVVGYKEQETIHHTIVINLSAALFIQKWYVILDMYLTPMKQNIVSKIFATIMLHCR